MSDMHAPAHHNSELKAWHPVVQQSVFRRLVSAFSYPGQIETICSDLFSDQTGMNDSALLHVLATLVDPEVTLADPDRLLAATDLSRLEARISQPDVAQFIVARADRTQQFVPTSGTLESPEKAATIILRVACLGDGGTLHLVGPGIKGSATVQVRGLNPEWLAARANWNATFPLGVDMLLVDDQRIVALPRTTRVTCATKQKGEC